MTKRPGKATSTPLIREVRGGVSTEIRTTPGGVTFLAAPMPHMASVSVGVWVAVGGRFEPEPITGASHFIEHMVFKGTHRRSAREISEAVECYGGYMNAFTSEENTCFYARAAKEYFDDMLDVLMDMVLQSRFAPADISKEREVIKDELAMYLDQPQQHVQEILNVMEWPGHPLGRPLTGTTKSLDALKRKTLVEHHRQHYTAPNMVIAAAGNLDLDRAWKTVLDLTRSVAPGERSTFTAPTISQTDAGIKLHTKPVEQTSLALGFRTCSRHEEQRFALRLLNALLGENMSSRLFQRIREDRGLAYNIYSSLSFFEDAGDLVISASLENSNLRPALGLAVRELRDLARRPPSVAELQRARDYVIGQMELSLEGTENRMMWLGEQWLGYGHLMPAEAIRERLARVTPSEVHSAARQFLRPERANLALVSPIKSTRGLAPILARLGQG